MPLFYRPRLLLLPALLLCGTCGQLQAAQFELDGVEGELADNVRAMLSVDDALLQAPPPTVSRLRYLHRQAPEEIRRALQPFGYYNPVLQLEINLDGPAEQWAARYQIDVGPITLEPLLFLFA